MKRRWCAAMAAALVLLAAAPASAQVFPTDDPVIRSMWEEGMERSQAYSLAQVLLDSIGPRLTGAPAYAAGAEWAVGMFRSWGVEARTEQYGTWRGWRRGISHLDLVEPRVRSLEAMALAWSPSVDGTVQAGVVTPTFTDEASFTAWLGTVRGNFVAMSFPEPTCRPDTDWEENATPQSFERMRSERNAARQAFNEQMSSSGLRGGALMQRVEEAGAVGLLTSSWPNGWGVQRVFSASTENIPTFGLGCEDYGLVYRLAQHNQGPVLVARAEGEFLGEVPTFNVIAEMRGTETPDEYVVLSAHFDSWDGGSGATDNGTGTVTVMEAMRILKAAYPNPKRTILVGLWNSEEQGLNGSRAFAADHPEVVSGLQALFNQDNGTGRITSISMQGLTRAGEFFARWLSQIPQEIGGQIDLRMPGSPGGGGSDYAAFLCGGAPSFFLSAHRWNYFSYTWHTNRDTFDKLVFDDVMNNATLFAMLTYLASEDPEMVPRDQRVLPINPRTGEQRTWPECRDGRRTPPGQ
jgi:carboxypeptidase Q